MEMDVRDRLAGAGAVVLEKVVAVAGKCLDKVGAELLDDENHALQDRVGGSSARTGPDLRENQDVALRRAR